MSSKKKPLPVLVKEPVDNYGAYYASKLRSGEVVQVAGVFVKLELASA